MVWKDGGTIVEILSTEYYFFYLVYYRLKEQVRDLSERERARKENKTRIPGDKERRQLCTKFINKLSEKFVSQVNI